MTKKEERNLTWKLGELPTAGEIAELVDSGVITKEEAREIMFGATDNDKDKLEAAEKLIGFLQNLVTELSKNKGTQFVPYQQTVYINRPVKRYWDQYWSTTNTIFTDAGISLTAARPVLGTFTSGSINSTAGYTLGGTGGTIAKASSSTANAIKDKGEAITLTMDNNNLS